MENIQLSYPAYFLILIAIISLVYAVSLYFRESKLKESRAWLPAVLGFLRWASVLTILFLLLTPLLKLLSTEEEKAIIVIAQDISESIPASTDNSQLNTLNSDFEDLKASLNEDYRVDEIYFGQHVELERNDSLNANSTNISEALQYISDSYEDENLGSVILVSDGIFNEGRNPIYTDMQLVAPIHTVALGDTSLRRDITIKNILHNRIVYLNDKFLIETDVQAYNAKGIKTQIHISKLNNGQRTHLSTQAVNIDKDRFFQTYRFELEATDIGNQSYRISVDGINNELSFNNNSRTAYVEVLDARQKILLLANSIHPDLKLLKKVIESNKNYELDIRYADDQSVNYSSYDVVILHNLPSSSYTMDQQIQMWNSNKTSLFYILGNSLDINRFNELQDVIKIEGGNFKMNDVTAVKNDNFSVFTSTEEFDQEIAGFVPLKSIFGNFILNPGSNSLLYQRIGSVETDYPLLAYRDANGQKIAVLSAEGIWRWGLMEYFEKDDQPICAELINKSIQYISQKDDKRQFRAFSNKKNFKENESILFDAQLYNDNFELINTPDASLTIRNSDNEIFEYIFSKTDSYYVLNAGRFPEGSYQYNASLDYNGKALSSSGSFNVQSIALESYDLTARHDILLSISDKFGGQRIYADELMRLDTLIKNDRNIRTVMYQKVQTKPFLDWPFILLFVVILLSIEWFLRRYFGSY